jgi:cytochrome o ubiquinol oxidase subunit 3
MKKHEHTSVSDRNLFGFWVYLMSDCVIFAGLFATYAVLGHATFGGPGSYELANLPFVFVETMLLLTSSFTAGLALLSAKQGNKKTVVAALLATLLLGAAFLSMEISEFIGLAAEGSGPGRSAFLSAFFTLLGTHGLHVFLGLVWLIALIISVVRRGLTDGNSRKLMMFSLFWHFLDIIWIFIFTFVYLFGTLAL